MGTVSRLQKNEVHRCMGAAMDAMEESCPTKRSEEVKAFGVLMFDALYHMSKPRACNIYKWGIY